MNNNNKFPFKLNYLMFNSMIYLKFNRLEENLYLYIFKFYHIMNGFVKQSEIYLIKKSTVLLAILGFLLGNDQTFPKSYASFLRKLLIKWSLSEVGI